MAAVEIVATPADTVALRGLMVPRAPFPPGAERSHHPCLEIAPSGLVDTGYSCRPNSDTMVVSAPPSGTVSVGGARFILDELQDLVREAGGGTLADAMLGHRLAGNAVDPAAVREALQRIGASPLLVGAFCERPHLSP
jgi:hypothetical protein